jgi:predicted DNA-binding transcriptional regulator AlpA
MFLTAEALADRWAVPIQTLYNLRWKGQAPPAIKIGRGLRFRLEDVEAWEAARRDDGGTHAA